MRQVMLPGVGELADAVGEVVKEFFNLVGEVLGVEMRRGLKGSGETVVKSRRMFG